MRNSNSVLLTGVGGFIGFHLAKKLLAQGQSVLGIDNLNDYYDVQLKKDRLAQLGASPLFKFIKIDIAQQREVAKLFEEHSITKVLHMAAQAGVRYSLTNPHAYVQSNLIGFTNILEGCRHAKVKHLIFASSSSVYGANTKIPFSESDRADHPLSFYGATKRANELMAYSYSQLFGFPCTGLRFFTVYGPWGRPDMAPFHFTKAILSGEPITIFNRGNSERDFTYVDDVVEVISRVLEKGVVEPFSLYNVGGNQPVSLLYCIELLENSLGIKAIKQFADLQPGDIPKTCADVSNLIRDFNFKPKTPLQDGIRDFVAWYRHYYQV